MFRYGTSWPGRRPGTRHWVSGPLRLWVLGWACMTVFWVLWLVLLAEIWLVAECYVLIASVALVLWDLAQRKRLDWNKTYFHRLRFGLWSLEVPEKGEDQ